ncbi:VOC family protein [Grimontia sp. S25]|uniref:VOC family protein n=2 Tax=Grimontia sedimenti TaxID=2711294 RepID=A0A6M1RH11_9GAMM|nr:VOC family protein [Grimontia sedimenti]
MDRAMAFYEAALGMTLSKQEVGGQQMAWFPVEKETAYGATGALVLGEPGASATTVYFGVNSIEDVLGRVTEEAVVVPKTAIGENFGFFAQLRDSEGNLIGIHSHT